MSPEERKHVKDEVNKIDQNYIRLNFSLDKERQLIKRCDKSEDLFRELYDKFSSSSPAEEVLEYLVLRLGDVPEKTYQTKEIRVDYDSYNSDYSINLLTVSSIPETDDAVVNRLMWKEREELRKALTIKFNAPSRQRRLEAQQKTLAAKKAKQDEAEIEAAKKLLGKKGFIVKQTQD